MWCVSSIDLETIALNNAVPTNKRVFQLQHNSKRLNSILRIFILVSFQTVFRSSR